MKYTNQFLWPKEVREKSSVPAPTPGALFLDGIEIDGYEVRDKWVPSFTRAGYGLCFERVRNARRARVTIIHWSKGGPADDVDILVGYDAVGSIEVLEYSGYGGGFKEFDSLGDAILSAEEWLENAKSLPRRLKLWPK